MNQTVAIAKNTGLAGANASLALAPELIVTATRFVETDRPFRGVLSALNLTNPIAFS